MTPRQRRRSVAGQSLGRRVDYVRRLDLAREMRPRRGHHDNLRGPGAQQPRGWRRHKFPCELDVVMVRGVRRQRSPCGWGG
eukprot:4545592-Prymnesium_polylepis.1